MVREPAYAPAVPKDFCPSLRWAFVHSGHVYTDRAGYRELIHATGLGERHKFVSRGLMFGMQKRWRIIARDPYGYNLSLLQWASKQPGFDSWMQQQPDIGKNTVRDVLNFVEGLERIDILPR